MKEEEKLKITKDTSKDKIQVDLSTITEVRLPNGHVYIKYNIKGSEEPTLLRIDSTNKSAKEIIEGIQNKTNFYKSNDALDNTYNILASERKYTREEVKLIPIEIIGNYGDNIRVLSDDAKKVISYYIQNKDNFKPRLKYINLDEMIALNEDGNVITCFYNKDDNKCYPRFADTVQYSATQNHVDEEIQGSIENVDFDAILDSVEINNQEVEIMGEKIDMVTLENYYQYPELIERKNMDENTRNVLRNLIIKYRMRKQIQEQQMRNVNQPKIKTLKINPNFPNKNAFANNILIAFLSGFAIAIFLSLVLYVIIGLFN